VTPLTYLDFERADAGDGVHALEAMASTRAGQHAAVMAEVARVLDWAWQQFPEGHGPLDDGLDWDHDLRVVAEDGGWHTVSLTISATARFADAFELAFGAAGEA
jgi:hypothetical protein